MESKRLEVFLVVSLILHLGLVAVLPWIIAKPPTLPPVFEVTWVKPVSRPIKPAGVRPSRKISTPKKTVVTPSKQPRVKAPKPFFSIQPAPIGSLGGQLALGHNIALPTSPKAKIGLGFDVPTQGKTGTDPQAKAGQPAGLSSEQVDTPPQNTQREPAALWQSKLKVSKQRVQPSSHKTGTNDSKNSAISGEVRGRRVIFTPPLPSLDLEQDVEVTLQFVVFADGSVGQIVVAQKSNSKLEALAIRLLGEYRFQPAPGSAEQSGVIRFVLRRQVN